MSTSQLLIIHLISVSVTRARPPLVEMSLSLTPGCIIIRSLRKAPVFDLGLRRVTVKLLL